MRRDFDASIDRMEQLTQVAAMKTPGRKHQKRAGVKAKQRAENKRRTALAHSVRKSREYHARVAAYWRGERDVHP